MARLWVLPMFGVLLASCQTSGLDWVREVEAGVPDGSSSSGDADDRSPIAAEPRSRPPPVRETVSLGETFTTPPERPTELPPRLDTPPENVDAPAPTLWGYPSGWAWPEDVPTRPPAPPSRTIQPGEDWPAPPRYGPAFPFRSAPASPWQGP